MSLTSTRVHDHYPVGSMVFVEMAITTFLTTVSGFNDHYMTLSNGWRIPFFEFTENGVINGENYAIYPYYHPLCEKKQWELMWGNQWRVTQAQSEDYIYNPTEFTKRLLVEELHVLLELLGEEKLIHEESDSP